jgi:hypothetical protein
VAVQRDGAVTTRSRHSRVAGTSPQGRCSRHRPGTHTPTPVDDALSANAGNGRLERRAHRGRCDGPAPTSRLLPGRKPPPVGTVLCSGKGRLLAAAQGLTNKQGLRQP